MPSGARRILFVCSQNRLRSPTAEQVFASWPGIEVASALSRRFRAHLRDTRVICLDIPDTFDFMEPALIALLRDRVTPYLRRT
jgi:predicted protein tyrosine phosphatase